MQRIHACTHPLTLSHTHAKPRVRAQVQMEKQRERRGELERVDIANFKGQIAHVKNNKDGEYRATAARKKAGKKKKVFEVRRSSSSSTRSCRSHPRGPSALCFVSLMVVLSDRDCSLHRRHHRCRPSWSSCARDITSVLTSLQVVAFGTVIFPIVYTGPCMHINKQTYTYTCTKKQQTKNLKCAQ
jgi:hypothetical protein